MAQSVARAGAGPLGDEPAFVLGDHVQSHRELAARAAAVAAGLRSVPALSRTWLPSGTRLLAIGTGNHRVFAELFTGATAGDGVCAVLDPQWGTERTRAVLDRLRPDLLVLSAGQKGTREAAGELGIRTLTAGDFAPGVYADGSGVRGGEPVTPGEVTPVDGLSSYETWLAEWAGADPAGHLVPGDDLAPFLVGFTSGSTGLPTAFHRSRRSWRISLAEGRKVWGMDEGQRTLAPGPLAHGLSLYALAECLESGAAFHGLPSFDAPAILREPSTAWARRLIVVPTMLTALCSAAADFGAQEAARHLASVRTVVSGGAKLPQRLLGPVAALLPRARVLEYYGASELGFVTVGSSGHATGPRDVGTAFPGVSLEVRDAQGAPVPPGTTGTVHVRTPLRCDGYVWGEGSFRQDGEWATVGDIGQLTEDGHLHLTGRGGMVITGGLNVYPSEVENALSRLEGIETALVTSVPDDYLGQALVAVVTGAAAGLGQSALRELCAAALPRYQVPRRFYTLATWPLTSSGKVARGRIEEWIAHEDARLVPLPGLSRE
ncbi:AMP-binding protein [Streptomyces tsukubensis]|nr:AMP-binding protein [Streptomyces tsukubensis]